MVYTMQNLPSRPRAINISYPTHVRQRPTPKNATLPLLSINYHFLPVLPCIIPPMYSGSRSPVSNYSYSSLSLSAPFDRAFDFGGGGGAISPSSLAPGVGGNAPGICLDPGRPSLFPVVGLPVDGRERWNSEVRGDVVLFGLCGFVNASPTAGRGRGLLRPFGEGVVWAVAAAFNRSSVAFRRASKASSSEVWEETFCFFSNTWASRSARLLSILKRSFSARENDRAIVDCGLAFGFHSRSSSSSDMM